MRLTQNLGKENDIQEKVGKFKTVKIFSFSLTNIISSNHGFKRGICRNLRFSFFISLSRSLFHFYQNAQKVMLSPCKSDVKSRFNESYRLEGFCSFLHSDIYFEESRITTLHTFFPFLFYIRAACRHILDALRL